MNLERIEKALAQACTALLVFRAKDEPMWTAETERRYRFAREVWDEVHDAVFAQHRADDRKSASDSASGESTESTVTRPKCNIGWAGTAKNHHPDSDHHCLLDATPHKPHLCVCGATLHGVTADDDAGTEHTGSTLTDWHEHRDTFAALIRGAIDGTAYVPQMARDGADRIVEYLNRVGGVSSASSAPVESTLTDEDEDELEQVRIALAGAFETHYGTGPTSGRFRAIWRTPDQAANVCIAVLRDRYAAARDKASVETEAQR